jgi:Transposase DDE domain group 1
VGKVSAHLAVIAKRIDTVVPRVSLRLWDGERRAAAPGVGLKCRVVAKAEFTSGGANPRFVVTSLKRSECKARYLYEKVYCARGDVENRIKECQLDLYADRTSTATMTLANSTVGIIGRKGRSTVGPRQQQIIERRQADVQRKVLV